jgi:hypothetical protein
LISVILKLPGLFVIKIPLADLILFDIFRAGGGWSAKAKVIA